MTQLSKYKLKPEVDKRINDILSSVFLGLKTKNELNNFLDDFLSPIEKTVLAKRLAIAVLIAKGNDYRSIGEILKVTPNTISKMSLHMKYGNGSIKKVTDKILTGDAGRIIIQELASFFDVPTKGLPISDYYKKKHDRAEKIYKLKHEI